MSILASIFGQSQPVSADNHFILRNIGAKTQAGVLVSEYSALRFPAVYACVNLIANTIAQLPLGLYQKTDNGSEPVTTHPLSDVLQAQSNDEMNAFTLQQTSSHHFSLWGNSYWEAESNRRGETIGLYPLLPDRTAPEKRRGEKLRYKTVIDGTTFYLPAENVVHLKALGHDGYCGISPLSLYRQAVGLGLAMEDFGSKFFANDAKSGGFLLHPGKLGAQAATNIKDSVQAQGGLDNAHRVKLLEEGMKFVSTTIPPEDAQFLASREFQVGEICRIYGVPGALVGFMEKSTSWGSGIEQLMIAFVVYTIQPLLVQREKEMNMKLLSESERARGMFIKYRTNAFMRGDMNSRAQFYNSAITNGWMTRNEVRALEDLNKLEGLDEPLVQRNMSSSDNALEPDAKPAVPSKTNPKNILDDEEV